MSRLAVALCAGLLTGASVILLPASPPAAGAEEPARENVPEPPAGAPTEQAPAIQSSAAPGEVPRLAYAHYCAGLGMMRTGDGKGALEAFQKVVGLDPEAHRAWFHLGFLHKARGDFSKAEECYARAVELRPDDVRSHLELGRVQLLLGKADEALQHWEVAAQKAEPRTAASIYERIAAYYTRKDDRQRAIAALRQALRLTDKPIETAKALLSLQEGIRDWPGAIETYRYILEIEPESALTHVRIAKCYEKLGKWGEAVAAYDTYLATGPEIVQKCAALSWARKAAERGHLPEKAQAYLDALGRAFDQALEAGVGDAQIYAQMVLLFDSAGDLQKAVEILTKALEAADSTQGAEIHEVLAEIYGYEGGPDQAEAHIAAAIELAPDDPDLHSARGALYADLMSCDQAVAAFLRAIGLAEGRKRMACQLRLAQVYVDMKQYDKAEAQLDAILKEEPENAATWAMLGSVRKDAGRLAEGAEALLKALEIGAPGELTEAAWRIQLAEIYAALNQPEKKEQQHAEITGLADDPQAALDIAYMLYQQRHYEQGLSVLQPKMDEMGEGSFAAKSVLSMLYQAAGEAELAEKELQRLIDENPNEVRAYSEMGSFLQNQKRYEEALKTYERALALDVDDDEKVMPRLSQADLLGEMGRVDEAEKRYREVFEDYPDLAVVNNNFSYFYAVHNRDLEEALEMVRKALRAEPDSAAYLDTLGWVLYRMGEYKGALFKTNQAYRKQKDAIIAEHLGDVLIKLGRETEALEAYRRGLEHDPGAEQLAEKIEELTKPMKLPQAQ